MKVRMILYGKVNETLTAEFPDFDVDRMYNYIASQYPDNNWEDVVCTHVDYGFREMTVRVHVI